MDESDGNDVLPPPSTSVKMKPEPDRITIIVTTSPIPSNPSPEMLTRVLASLSSYFSTCPIILVFDGFTVNDTHVPRFKTAKISTAQSIAYKEFKIAVHQFLPSQRLESATKSIKHKPEISTYEEPVSLTIISAITRTIFSSKFQTLSHSVRVGFALAVRSAISHVTTPYVLILQHDWAFKTIIPIEEILTVMDEDEEINYVGFVTRRSLDYINRKSNRAPSIKAEVLLKNGQPFSRLFFWYDRPHVGRTDYYKTQVFGQKRFKRGDFIEDTFGHTVMTDCRNGGLEGWKPYGCWLWYPDDGLVPTVRHLNGRRFCEEPGYWTKNEMGVCYYRFLTEIEVK